MKRVIFLVVVAALFAGYGTAYLASDDVRYLTRAGIEETRILHARQPITELAADPRTDPALRDALGLVVASRDYAARLGLEAKETYTTYADVGRDTLLLVLQAAPRDCICPYTWKYPIVGRIPYKGFFDTRAARREADRLAARGYDVHLRPSGAFSTLGWFNDPLLSSILRSDEVDLVETITHELSHNHLFVPGQVTFNESFANFVGRTGSARFFCSRPGSGPDSVKCARAQARWRDEVRFSRFLDGFLDELRALYADPQLASEEKVRRRETIFAAAKTRFRDEVQPTFEQLRFGYFLSTPLNNATLIATMIYYHRLADFDALLAQNGGDLRAAIAKLKAGVETTTDPYTLLPTSAVAAAR